MKVFDCQEMPNNIKTAFFSFYEDPSIQNDVYVSWTVQEDDINYNDDNEFAIKRRLIDDYLIENGADQRKDSEYNGETVLINHWW